MRPQPSSNPGHFAAPDTRACPKVLLHDHLDGSLRPGTLLALLRERGLAAPAADVPALLQWLSERAHAGSLEEYLKGFALTVAAMATPAALERVAAEAVEDAAADGCVLAEFRIAPLLFEPHGTRGDAAVEALLAGLARGSAATGLPAGLIVCAMRHESADETARAAALAVRWRAQGVLAFDLAGAERGHPPGDHARALAIARDGGLGLTLHAGESDAGERVLEALRLGATRIGHGVRLAERIGSAEWPAIRAELDARGAHLEVCPTSNVHTGAAESVAMHPIRALWAAGVSLSVQPDNRLISGVTMSSEADALMSEAGFDMADLLQMQRQAAQASFLPAAVRASALVRIDSAAASVIGASTAGA